jgi:aryl-alcohol dehydrogenase-like predicted oxidoreductase
MPVDGTFHEKWAQLRRDGRPEHIRACCDDSLRRLGVEVIDLYQLHRVDKHVPVEESVGAMAELVEAGKVRGIGLCEVDVPTLERAATVHPIASVQSELSLWTRDALAEVLPWCATHAVGFIPYSPLGRGFLTGRYRSTSSFDFDDFRILLPRFGPLALRDNLAIVDAVEALASCIGTTPAQLALAWVCAQGTMVVPIPGAKRLAHLEENIGAASLVLDDDILSALEALPLAVGARY